MTAATPPGRNPPTPRVEGMEHLVDATIELLQELPPEQLTVRQVAERAGHHHRFINEWFGGKSGLVRAALDEVMSRALAAGDFPAGRGGINPHARLGIQIMGWLAANDRQVLLDDRPTMFRERMVEIYRGVFGLDLELAEMVAERTMAASIGIALFGDLLDIDDDRFDEHRLLEIRIAQLLAADSG